MRQSTNVFKVLKDRGFIQSITSSDALLESHLNEGTRTCYIGFDPTAESLHIGNLLQLMCLRHFQKANHNTIALIGGATGLIGDPSGRSTERPLLLQSTIDTNTKGIENCIKRVLSTQNIESSNEPPAIILNNYDWFKSIHLLEFLRDYGKLFKVPQMLNKNSVKSRMLPNSNQSEGISFTEFSYQLLQAYDFLHLYKEKSCSIQIGGSDQWGNITSGIQLIHRIIDTNQSNPETFKESNNDEILSNNHLAFGLTLPLITTADGKKLGKSSASAGAGIWLDPLKTKPYDMYQYIINLSDSDAQKFLPLFTFLELSEISDIIKKHDISPHERLAQKTLAFEIVQLLHGTEEAEKSK